MQVVSADHDLDLFERFEVVVDQDAEPVDLDEALAEFLLKIVEQRRQPSGEGEEGRRTARPC